jgi:copper chaperone CopZ
MRARLLTLATATVGISMLGLATVPAAFAEDTTSTGYSVDHTSDWLTYAEYDALVQTLQEAQDEVERLELEVQALAAELALAEAALESAEQAQEEAEQAVADARTALEEAEEQLEAAVEAKALAQSAYDAIVCTGLTGQPRAACNHSKEAALDELNGANADVEQADLDKLAAKQELDDAIADLEAADRAVEEAGDAVTAASGAYAEALSALAEAELARDIAEESVQSWTPPAETAHPGCTGVLNAKTQVAKSSSSKGKAGEVLDKVAGKLGC